VNGLRTLEGIRDVLALVESGVAVDWLLLPKTEHATDVQAIEAWCGAQLGAITALVETPLGIENLASIARAGGKLGALMLGGADLSAELDAQFNWDGLLSARGRLVNAAKSTGLQAWDVPNVDLSSEEGLASETRKALALGFGCKTAIHPQQIKTIHAAFTPTPAEIEWATVLLQAVPEGPGQRRLPVPGKDGRRAAAQEGPAHRRAGARFVLIPVPSIHPTGDIHGPDRQARRREPHPRNLRPLLRGLRIGEIYEHRPGRTISETDNTWFTLLTMNTHPMHFDAEYAKASEFGKCIVCSPLTVALMVGMSVTDVSQKAIANLGWTDIKLTHPLFAGDTLYAESEVIDKRESSSRPGAGIVTVKTIGLNQDGKVVGTFNRTMLIAKRGHSVEDKVNY
jgi:acyl dehydratase